MEKELSEMSNEELWELFPIILKEHNPAYKDWYQEEKDELLHIIEPGNIKRIDHVGSSFVEGLLAKPTVDILLEVADDCDIEQLKEKLKNAGWQLMHEENKPDLRIVFNKGYTPQGFADRVFHLHVRYYRDWNELYFRDYLAAHPEIAKEYGELKQNLKKRYEHDRDGYTDAKTDFIMKYTKIAKEEFKERYVPVDRNQSSNCINSPGLFLI